MRKSINTLTIYRFVEAETPLGFVIALYGGEGLFQTFGEWVCLQFEFIKGP